MTEGMWLTMAAGVLGLFGTAITAIIKLPQRNNRVVLPDACPAHSGLVAEQHAMHEDITEIKGDIKSMQVKQDAIIITTTEIKAMLEVRR